jgi:hypothetical protein
MPTGDADGPSSPDGPAPADPGPAHEHPLRDRIVEAAYEAERETGRREETEEELRRGVIIRLARMVGGFVLIGVGISLLVLPGPGWVMIVIGLSLLPFAWAERTIRAIRRRVPGIPEDGAIPVTTWIIMGVIMVGAMAIALLFGDTIGTWVSGAWEDLWS